MLIYGFKIKICSYCSHYILKLNGDKYCACDLFLNNGSFLDCETCKAFIEFLERRFIPVVSYNESGLTPNYFGNSLTGVEYMLSANWNQMWKNGKNLLLSVSLWFFGYCQIFWGDMSWWNFEVY